MVKQSRACKNIKAPAASLLVSRCLYVFTYVAKPHPRNKCVSIYEWGRLEEREGGEATTRNKCVSIYKWAWLEESYLLVVNMHKI